MRAKGLGADPRTEWLKHLNPLLSEVRQEGPSLVFTR